MTFHRSSMVKGSVFCSKRGVTQGQQRDFSVSYSQNYWAVPRILVTDKLRSCGVVKKQILGSIELRQHKRLNVHKTAKRPIPVPQKTFLMIVWKDTFPKKST
ncbi:hypothetical protein MIDIC_340031 [Alphaproteobacteria bacterium]